jgi:ERCC4-type nuclease
MVIQVDSREKAKAIKTILSQFESARVKYFVSKLFVGDYQNLDNSKLVVDRKRILELVQNVCQDHKRFTAELERAKEYGIHVIVLCENTDGIESLQDVLDWVNPRLKESPMAVSGERLFRILSTMQCNSRDYSVEFQFCDKSETGSRIIELLGGGPNE